MSTTTSQSQKSADPTKMAANDGNKSKLSIHSSGYDKSVEKISIFIKKCKNINTLGRPEGLTLYAKIDFNEASIGESQKIHVTADNVPDLNFNASISVNTSDQTSLDEIAYKPVIVTLIEVLPKEKKQKDEKVQPYGQCTFDLLSLLKGATDTSLKLTVHPIPGSQLESLPSDGPLPELECKLLLEQTILSDEEYAKSNLMTVGLEGMYALPESWNNAQKEYAYTVAFPVPLNDDKETPIVFVNGIHRTPADPVIKQKRWADTRGIQATNALFLPTTTTTNSSGSNITAQNSHDSVDSSLTASPSSATHLPQSSEELGDFTSKEEKEYKSLSEKEKSRIVWHSERRCFLNGASNATFREQILKNRYFPIEVVRSSVPTGAAVKGKRDEDLHMSYRGVVYVDMQPLLYPGATRIRGAYKVNPYVESEYIERTKRKSGIADDALKVVGYLYDRNFAISPLKKTQDAKANEKKEVKKARESNVDGNSDISQSIQQIIDSKSFIVIDIKFDKPLIPRKPYEYLVKRVAELIPPRPKYPIRINSAESAVSDYHAQIKSIISLVLDEYRSISLESQENDDSSQFVGGLNSDPSRRENQVETRRKRLLYELNSTGKYFALKEQLKNSVIKIVREKFFKTSALNDPEEFQQFISELYVFLVDELHKAINNNVTIEDNPVMESNLTDMQQMRHFALEAEMNRNYDLAAFYYQERIARDKDSYSNWLDYAQFNLLIEEYARSEECLRECIGINQNEINGLLMYSVICAMQEKNDVAETFLERVLSQESTTNVIAWTLYALLYEQKGQDQNAEITLKEATKMNIAHLLEAHGSHDLVVTEGNEEAKKVDDESPFVAGGAESSDSKIQVDNKSRNSKRATATGSVASGGGKGVKQDSLSKTPKSPGIAITAKAEDPSNSLKDKLQNAELAIDKSIFMKTANFLVKHNAFAWAEKCMAKELVSPHGGPSCQYHIILAKIKLAKSQLEDAEKHCNDALMFDYQNYEAWIVWAHTRYLSGDFRGAKERYERILQFSELPLDQTHSIYIRLASIYLKEENFEDSKKLFLYPCKSTASCMSWLGVGICSYRLDQLDEAKSALCEANILNNKAPEVWAYLSLICLKTNKPLEAEQAYKYAIKLNLDNPELLEEIRDLQEKVGYGNPEF